MTTATVPDHFTEWLEAMHPRLWGFIDFQLPTSVPRDFSREALRQFEEFLLSTWADADSFTRGADADFTDGAIRYVGEAYLREFGGGWTYTDDAGALFPGVPCVLLDVGRNPISPYHLMTTSLIRRTGEVLAGVWDGQLLNLADLREERGADWRPRRQPVPGITRGTDAEEAPKPDRDVWVAGLDGRIAALRARVGEPAATELDLSVGSLGTVDRLVLAEFDDPDEFEGGDSPEPRDEWVSYVGEVFRRHGGGEWVFRPAEPGRRSRFLGRPYLKRVDESGNEVTNVPADSLKVLISRRTAGRLQQVFDAYAG